MTDQEKTQPATRGDLYRIEIRLDKVLVGLHGDGTKVNEGLFHRQSTTEAWIEKNKDLPDDVNEIKGEFKRLKKHIAAIWTGGITVAANLLGLATAVIAERMRH